MTFVAYLDDSFLPGGPVYAVGGYGGDLDSFSSELVPAWNEVITNAPHKISEFKTSDCRQGRGEFSAARGWTRAERDELTKRLVGVLAEKTDPRKIVGYSSVMAFPFSWNDSDAVAMEHNGFFPCFLDALQVIVATARSVIETGERVQIILDEKAKYVEPSERYFLDAMRTLPLELAEVIERPKFRDSRREAPLQAADLLVYETMKEARSRMLEPSRPVSKALVRLAGSRTHWARCSTWDQLMEIHRLKSLGYGPESGNDRLKPMLLYESGSPWRAPHHWPHAGR